jgi:hypothetical protein
MEQPLGRAVDRTPQAKVIVAEAAAPTRTSAAACNDGAFSRMCRRW